MEKIKRVRSRQVVLTLAPDQRDSAYDINGAILAALKQMTLEDVKQKLFARMKEENLIKDFEQIVNLERLTGLKVEVGFDSDAT